MRKSSKRLAVGLGAFAILGLLAYPKIEPLISNPSQQESQMQSSVQKAESIVVSPQNLQRKISTTGSLIANETVNLNSETSGKITDIYLEEGKPVQEGDLLLKINDSELQAQLKRAEYRFELASQREERQKKLLEKGGISQEDYDATLNEVNVLKSEIDLIEAQIAKTEIRAPFEGTIGLKYVSEGSYISSSTQIASLQNIDPIKIDFSIPERYAGQVQVDDTILFNVQTSDNTFEGRIYAIEPVINRETRSLQLRALSENRDALLLPGSFANIQLILESRDDALTVPSISLVPEAGGQFVYVYRNGQAVKQEVSTGIRSENLVEITNGLSPQDTVLTTGLLQVRDNMPVELSNIETQGRL